MNKNKILILSPHTDDAELGCGGAIARFVEEKKDILWYAFSTAEDSLPQGCHKDTLRNEFIDVCNQLKLNELGKKAKLRAENDFTWESI